MKLQITISEPEFGAMEGYILRLDDGMRPERSQSTYLTDVVAKIECFINEAWNYHEGYKAGLAAANDKAA